jgi:hypothetical protein
LVKYAPDRVAAAPYDGAMTTSDAGHGGPAAKAVTFRAAGHPEIRATHTKTLELTADPAITARATCVLGVGAGVDAAALGALEGRVTITIEAGGVADTVTATANPGWSDPGSVIVRKSAHTSPATFATDADKGAADLDRTLVAALADPAATVTVTVAEVAPAAHPAAAGYLAVPDGRPAALTGAGAAALAAADLIVTADLVRVRRLLGRLGGGVAPAGNAEPVIVEADAAGRARAAAAVRAGQLVLLVDTGGIPGGLADLDGEVPVRPVGVPPSPELGAVAAAGLGAGPVTVLPPSPGRDARVAALAASTAATLVWREDEPTEALGDIHAARGDAVVWVALDPGTRTAATIAGTPDELRDRVQGVLILVVPPVAGAGDGVPVDTDALLTALLAAGVPGRTLAEALGTLPGHTYRRAYAHVLDLKDRRP